MCKEKLNSRICCSRTYQTNQTNWNDKRIERATFDGQPAAKKVQKDFLSLTTVVSGKHMYGNKYFIQECV